jgi:phosphate-selective porin OprO and OprP
MFESTRSAAVLLSLVLSSVCCLRAAAQDTSAAFPPPLLPALPAADDPNSSAPVPSRESELQDEVRQLKAMVRELSSKVDQLSAGRAPSPPSAVPPLGPIDGLTDELGSAGGQPPGGGVFGPAEASAAGGGSAAARGPLEARRTSRFNMPGISPNFPTTGIFGPGFQLQTRDEEFQLQFHDLTQVDGRFYTKGEQVPITSTFLIPRQWFIFSGRLSKPFEYYTSIAEGIDSLNILDVFLNINFDKRLQFKIGRYKTPFTYEFYNLPINAFITPERSLFFNNFGLNRDIGLMAWGSMFDNRFDYALGIFNGTRNGYVDSNDFKDFVGLLNYRPFATWTDHPLENLSFGGSTDTGLENNVPIPQVFRTNVATTGNLAIGPEFLALNKNVMESGLRTFWSLYMAYYYQRLSLVAEWESGYDSFGIANQQYHTRVPVQSFYVMGGYFLTGETVSSRGIVKPLRDFDVRRGRRGPGAIELIGRYNYLNIGRDIFTAGLADPALWTNQLYTVDAGANWYWTQFIKVYMGWQHAGFGNAVSFAPERFQNSSDQFWLRFQIYF